MALHTYEPVYRLPDTPDSDKRHNLTLIKGGMGHAAAKVVVVEGYTSGLDFKPPVDPSTALPRLVKSLFPGEQPHYTRAGDAMGPSYDTDYDDPDMKSTEETWLTRTTEARASFRSF